MLCQDGRQRRSLVGSGSHDEATDKPLAHADKVGQFRCNRVGGGQIHGRNACTCSAEGPA